MLTAASLTAIDPFEAPPGRARHERTWLAGEFAMAAVVHAVVAVLVVGRADSSAAPREEARPPTVLDVEVPPQPPPSPVAEPSEPPPARSMASKPSTPTDSRPRAQAAALLTRTSRPDEPVDLSESFVAGSASVYAGGTSAADGTSTRAVHVASSPSVLPTAAVSAAPASAPDRSTRPRMIGGGRWGCPFPGEADTDRVDTATVEIRVTVDASGAPGAIAVLEDPGHGFAREAKRCALAKRWSPALDRDGKPTEGTVSVNVRFDR